MSEGAESASLKALGTDGPVDDAAAVTSCGTSVGQSPDEGLSWREGDIYFWHWNKLPQHMPYHCCSCKAVVHKGGLLIDTFWSGHSDNRFWTKDDAAAELNLEYKGNFDGITPINAWEAPYYEETDIVDMRHSNSSAAKVYRRNAAQRSKDRMIAVLNEKRENAQADIRWAISRLEQAAAIGALIQSGAPLEGIYL